MNSIENVKKAFYEQGKQMAIKFQGEASEMNGTEINDNQGVIPDFQSAKANLNMLKRPIGFICRSTAGRVVGLLQVYDSSIFPDEPEKLPAQWRFVWSKNPQHAQEFVAISTSPYNKGECCKENGKTYRSTIDSNVTAPSVYPQGWTEIE